MKLFRTSTTINYRQLSNQSTRGRIDQALVLNVYTWPPSKKISNQEGDIINRIPLTPLEAKRMLLEPRASNITIDPYGHASAELSIKLADPSIPPNVIKYLEDKLKQYNIALSQISEFRGYVSWYPKTRKGRPIETGRKIDSKQREQLLLKLQSEDENINTVKGFILNFLEKEYEAKCADFESDVMKYGLPPLERSFSFTNIDFISVIETIFKMMSPKLSPTNIVSFEDVRQEATYFGLDLLLQNSSARNIHETDLPVHVCTTAVLRLLRSGIGIEVYNEIFRKITTSNPDFSHGFPIVDITHALAKEIHHMTNSDSVQLKM